MPDPERGLELPAKPQILDRVGLSEAELDQISILIGGDQAKEVDSSEQTGEKSYETVIVEWGDQELENILADLTQSRGYEYGAEHTHLVALTAEWAILMHIVPQLPIREEDIVDEKGEVDPLLQNLVDPSKNPANVFYEWSRGSKKQVDKRINDPNKNHQVWVKVNEDYYLKWSLAANFEQEPQ